MIITILIIPMSLPVFFIMLFYYAFHSQWFLTFAHLSAVGQWHGMTGNVCLILLAAVAVISVVAALITAILVAFLNRQLLPRLKLPLNR